MNNHRLLLFLLASILTVLLPAQDYHTVFVGAFVKARPQDFDEVRKLGFIYTQTNDNKLEEVYLGQYPSKGKANNRVQEIKALGFSSAQVVSGYYGDPSEVAVIQIATRYSTQTINWGELSQAGPLNVLLADDNIKVLTGTFTTLEAAKAELPQIRALGFRDAFVKRVKLGQLLPVTPIATGIKEELIPLQLSDSPASHNTPSSNSLPKEDFQSRSATEVATPNEPYVPRPVSTDPAPIPTSNLPTITTVSAPTLPEIPTIRGNIKRTSATKLQQILQAEGYYNSALDGYYGTGTTAAYERMLRQDSRVQKYRLLIPFYQVDQAAASTNTFQQTIDQLPYDANAPLVIENNNTPTGQAYRAYLLFTTLGPNAQINQLMNAAIKGAYANTRVSTQVFNYQATYAYQDLQQLLLHLFYVHAAPTNSYTLPCWFDDRHPRETDQALRQMGNYSAQVGRSGCASFSQWEEIQLLQAIAFDIAPETALLTAERQATQNLITELSLTRTAIKPAQATLLENWQNSLWRNIDGWVMDNSYLQNVATCLRFTYLQSAVRLEDYYMNQRFEPAQARSLAIATLRALLELPLRQFE